MKTSNIFLYILSLMLPFSNSSGHPVTLSGADSYYKKLQMGKAFQAYQTILLTQNLQPGEKAVAYLRLSRISAKILRQPDTALYFASKGLEFADKSSIREFCLVLSEAYLEKSDYENATIQSLCFLQNSTNEQELTEALNLMLKIKISEIESEARTQTGCDLQKLEGAILLAGEISCHQPESPVNNERRLELCLLKGSLTEAYVAVKDYFLLDDDSLMSGYLHEAISEFNTLTLKYQPEVQLSTTDKVELIRLLGQLRFFDMASLLAKAWQVERQQELHEILAYSRFRMSFERAVSSHYSGILLGQENDRCFRRQLDDCYHYLWNNLSGLAGKKYNLRELMQTGGERFGMQMFCKEKGGYHVYILGEAIYSSDREVEQYGYSAPFRFCEVDHIVGGHVRGFFYDYFDWGGWSEDGMVAENRRLLLDGAITQYEKISGLTDTEIDSIIFRLSKQDDTLLSRNELADLPGLRKRFELRALESIRDTLIKQGFSDSELRKKMISRIRLVNYLSSTLAHEGRHVIDSKNGFAGRNHAHSEYTANLSSVAFSPIPQLSLSRVMVYDPLSGDPTGHSKADSRIVEGFYDWMVTHSPEIAGLDPHRPLLSQADLLSNGQIVTICRSLDPLNSR